MRTISPDEAERLIDVSVRRYRWAHRRYERKHPEIFNPTEQGRLREALGDAVARVRTGADTPRALDLGCGSGNLTRHLLRLGARVVAADVSPHFLQRIRSELGATGRVETLLLNGRDLEGVPDGSFDLVCAYSVLHHIPDYLAAIDEICRTLAPGGIAYLDHESNETFYDKDGCFWDMLREIQDRRVERANWWNGGRRWWDPENTRWQRYLQPSRYYTRLRQVFNPAYPWDVEGDIHTWPLDHIEWDKVEERLAAGGCEVVRRDDYLNYSSEYPVDIWQRYEGACSSMRLVVAQRTSSA